MGNKVVESDWYFRINEDGLTERINALTGEVRLDEIKVSQRADYELVEAGKETYWVPRSMTHNTRKQLPAPLPMQREYSIVVAEGLCLAIAEGSTIRQACQKVRISYTVFSRWRREREEFASMVKGAFSDRALFIHEKLLSLAEETDADRDEIALAKLKSEIYKHVASIDNDRFNPKQKVEADHRVGIVALDTGIRRDQTEFPGPVTEGDATPVSDKEDKGVVDTILEWKEETTKGKVDDAD